MKFTVQIINESLPIFLDNAVSGKLEAIESMRSIDLPLQLGGGIAAIIISTAAIGKFAALLALFGCSR